MLKSDEIDDDGEVFFSAREREGIVTIDGDDKSDEKWGVEMQTIVFRDQGPEGQFV
jgi:hypothetical protein